MANSNLRLEDAPSRSADDAPGWGALRRASLLAGLAVLVALAGSALFVLHERTPQQPSFVDRALGPKDGTFRLARRWDALTKVRVTRAGIRIAHAGHTVSLAAAGTGSGGWTRHATGASRPTPFGSESIVAAAPRAEELLTVDRHLGARTWRWHLDAGGAPPVVEGDGSVSLAGGSIHVLPVAIYDRSGRDVTPAGSRFGIARSRGAIWLTLRLDDASLPTPYTIDPIAVVGTPVTGNTKTGSPLPAAGNLALPAVANGNLLVASFTLRDPTATVTIDSGIADPHPWTVLTTIRPSNNSQQQIVYWKVWQTGDPTSTKWSWSGGSGASDSAAGVIAYSGIYTGASPIETFTTNSALAATTASTTAGSNTFANSMILLTYGISSRDTVATPGGTTSEWSITSTSAGPTVRATSQGFQIAQAAAGAIPAYSGAVSTDDYTAAMLSIAPAVGTPTAANSTLSASPASVTADGSSTSTVTATLKDAAGNPVSGKTVTLTAGSGSSTITTLSGTTNAAGQATFSVKDAVAQSVTYTAKDTTDNVTVTQTATVTFNPGTPTAAQSTVSASPTSVTANGSTTSTVTVTLKDASSNAVPGKTVTLSAGSGSSTITTVTGTTNAAGQATFTVKDTVAEGVTYTAKDTTDNVTVTQTATVTFTAGPVNAAQSTVSPSPGSVVADGSSTSTVTVTLKDANSNPVSGKTVTLIPGAGASTVTTVSGTTNASGQATFTVKDSTVESVTYTAKDTTDNVTVTQTATVAFTIGPVTAAQSTVSASPASVVADGASASTVTVTLKDAQSRGVSGKTVTLTAGSGSSTVTTVSGTTNASGQATFSVKDTIAEGVTYTAKDTTDNVTVTQTATVTFTAGPVTAGQSTVSASPATLVADGVTASTVTVTLKDAGSNPVSGKAVTLTAGSGTSTVTTVGGTTNASGQATFTVKDAAVESVTYTAKDTTDNVTVTQTATVGFTVGPVTAAQSTVSASPGSVVADGASTSTITVTLKDAQSHPVSGKTVTLAKSGGSSTVTTVGGTTDTSGQASFTVKDTVAEATTYTATDTTDSVTVTQTASVAFTAGTPTAAGSTVVASPPSVAADNSTTSTITVTLKDAGSNAVPGKAVSLTAGSGSSTITTVTGTTNASGQATFTVKDAAVEPVTYTARDTTDNVTVTQTATVSFSAGAVDATASTAAASPSSVVADGSTASTVTVTAKDAFGHVLSGQTVSLAAGSGSSTITTVSGTTNVSGQATFAVKDTVAQTVVYTATIGATPVLQTASVAFVPGAATHFTLGAPASRTAGSPFGVTVTALDANGNTATAYAGTVHFTSSDAQATLPADYTFAAGDNGVHAFTATLATAGSKSITAADAGVTGTASVAVSAGGASASHSTVSSSPASVPADGSTSSTVTVTIADAYDNPVAGKTVTLAGSPTTSSITTLSGTTDAAGRATFSVTSTVGGTVTYTATDTSDSLTVTQTGAVDFVPATPDAGTSSVSASPASVQADGTTASTITVTLRDAGSSPVAGKTVALAKSGGSSNVSPASAVTNAAGVATFTVTDVVAESAVYTATVGSTTVTQTAGVSFTPGPANAADSSLAAAPASLAAGGTATITVRTADAFGNALSSGGATVLLSSDHGTLSPVADNGDGTYTATLGWTGVGTAHVTGTLNGAPIGTPASVTFAPGAANAAQSTIDAAPAAVTADGSSTSTITVRADDLYGNPLTGGGATVVLSTDRGTIGAVTDKADGTYTATLTAGTVAGIAHVTGTLNGAAIGAAATVSFVPGAASAAQSAISASPASITADGASTSTITVRARDANDNDVTTGGSAVVLAADRGSLGAVVDNGDGTYTATLTSSTTARPAHVTGTLGGTAIGASATVSFLPGAPSATHSAVSAAPTTLVADGAATSAVTVHLRDGNDNDLTSGGASVALTTDAGSLGAVTDNADGTYSATLTAPTTVGTAHVAATVNGEPIASSAAVTLIPGAVSASHSTVAASTGVASADGGSVSVTVTALDAHDNPISGAAVLLSQGPGSASISPVLGATTDAAGKATFTVSDTVAETAVFSATVAGTLVTQTASVLFQPGAADHLAYGQQPANATAGATLAPSVTVRVLDAHDNLTSSTAAVTLAVKTGATLVGTTTRNAVAGVATFDDLSIATAGSGYVLTASAAGAGGADSATFDVAPAGADAAHTVITASPAAINADGTSGASTITVHARDAFDNPLAAGGATVVLAASRGSLSQVTDDGDGTYTATLTATGQSGAANIAGTLDGNAIGHPTSVTLIPPVPVAAIDGGVGSPSTSATSASFSFHSPNDDGNTTFDCSLDGASFAACTSPKAFVGLADGSHTFRVHGVNANGPGADDAQSWTVDTVGPTTTLTTGPAGYTNNPVEPLAATANDATTSVAAVDFRFAATAAACPSGTLIASDTTAPYTAAWTLPADGSYVVCAVAVDAVGNAGAASSSTVVVDRTKPAASLSSFGTVVGPTTYVSGTASLHASATDATAGLANVDVSFAGAASGSIAHLTAAPYDTSWDTSGLPDGAYTVTAAATDRAGNADLATRSVTVDNTPPTASLDDPGAYGHGTIPLTVSAADSGSGVDTAATVIESSPHGAGTWTPVADPANWAPADGTYDLRATVEDAVGNRTVTATRTILVDNTPPSVTDDGDASWHNTDVTLTLSAADGESGIASVEYKIDGAPSWTTGTTVSLPTSLGDGTHTVTYRATNRAGVTSAPTTATVKLDGTAPTVGDPSVAPAAAFARGTVDLSSAVSDGAGSGVASTSYRLAPAGTAETAPPSACATWGSPVASHLDTTTVADGTYALRTVAADNALNTGCSNIATATTLKIDNTPPRTSDDAPFGTQNADVTVHLTATDNSSGVAETDYRVDGGAWTTGASVTIAAPASHANDGTHTIEYRSTDVAGNVEATKTTQVTVDTTAPGGSGVDPASLLHGTVQLDASPSESDIASVEWLYRPAGSSGPWTSVGVDHAAPWQTSWLTTGVPDGGYDLEAVFTDTTGNTTTQAFSAKTVDNTAPDTAAVTAPLAGTDLSGTIALAATAHDATAGIDPTRTTFQIQATGDSGWADVAGNHFDTTTKPDGPAQVRVAVWDVAGNGPLYSAPVAFVVDNTAPTVSLTAPTVASGTTALSASGSADIASVDFEVSPHDAGAWTLVSSATAAPFTASWATGSLADGLYDVRATASDHGGNRRSDVATVRVDNTAPTTSLAQPGAGATVGGASASLAATASDGGSGIASVTFQYRLHGSAGAFTDVGTTSTAPYGATWDVTGLASGDYDVRAVAADAAGNNGASAVRVVTVDSTPPSLTAFTLPSFVSGTRNLQVTTSVDTASVTYAVTPSGGSGWTQVGTSSTVPTFASAFDTTSLADGTYDVRATAVDRYGNTTSITVPSVRVDNTPPSLVSSTPADGSVVTSLSSIDAAASESLSAVDSLELDGAAAPFTAAITGANVAFPTGPLAEGAHALTGTLVDLAGNTYPFRIDVTVASGAGAGADPPPTSKNVSNVAATTLGTVDSSTTVTVPAGVWQQPLPTADDWLVLRVDPLAPTAVVGTTSLPVPLAAVDVRMFWNLAGTEEHHFDAPVQIDLTDPTGGFGIAATLENGAWRHLDALATPGVLPAGQQDGYWRSGGVVHVLTRHLSVFAVLNTLATLQLAPPDGFSGVVASDGLTLRWMPGMAEEQLKGYTLYVDGAGARLLGPTEHEAKLGPITTADERRFTITETTLAGGESGPSVALRVVPAVTGLSVADATKALAARTFTVGRTIPAYAPQAPAGTVVGPTDIQVLPEGSAVDLQVAAPSLVRSPFTFSAAAAPRAHARLRMLVGRVVVSGRARLDVTLDAHPWVRIQRWHFRHVTAGPSIVRLVLRRPLKPGTYRLFWKATAEADGASRRQITPLAVVPPNARVHSTSSPQVVVVGAQSTLPTFTATHVETVSPEQTYLYATHHDASAIVVDADVRGLAYVRSLRTVFPDTWIVALSRSPSRLAAAARAGAVPVAASTPKAKLARLVLALAAR